MEENSRVELEFHIHGIPCHSNGTVEFQMALKLQKEFLLELHVPGRFRSAAACLDPVLKEKR